MKIVEIVPRARSKLYGTLVAKEAAIRKSGRGTYVRVGRKSQRAARWKHKKFKGTLALTRGDSDAEPILSGVSILGGDAGEGVAFDAPDAAPRRSDDAASCPIS